MITIDRVTGLVQPRAWRAWILDWTAFGLDCLWTGVLTGLWTVSMSDYIYIINSSFLITGLFESLMV